MQPEHSHILHIWAKASRTNHHYHPLLFHMMDTAMVAQVIWNFAISPQLRRLIARGLHLPCTEARELVSYIAGLHDIGKASPSFQSRLDWAKSSLSKAGLIFPTIPPPPATHGTVGMLVIEEWLSNLSIPSAHSLAAVLAGHHGTFSSKLPGLSDMGRVQGDCGMWDKIRHELLTLYTSTLGFDASSVEGCTKTPDPPTLLILAGLVSVADWIASSENFFPYENNLPPQQYKELSHTHAKAAIRTLGWKYPQESSRTWSFSELFKFKPRPLQAVVEELARNLRHPGLVLIEAPMGEGKTEAAFILAEYWMHHLGQQGCYVAMPTIATANGIFGRFAQDYLSKTHPNDASKLRLLHGQASLYDSYQQPHISTTSEDNPDDLIDEEDEENTASAEDWFSFKKRGLLSPYAVGTIDQALLSVMQVKHGFVRLFGLAGKTIILDEVHAYDIYTRTILTRLVEWLRAEDSTIVLLSATLPTRTRRDLLMAYDPSLKEIPSAPYPRITVLSHSTPPQAFHVDQSATAKSVHLKWIPSNDEELVATLDKTLANGGCAACICNTVPRAQELYKILKAHFTADEVKLFHARYPFHERDSREKIAIKLFGKEAVERNERPYRAILVATQVIEQSLDLDFDVMISEPAPADLILQSLGRLWRHDITPRRGITEPVFWLCDPPTDADGIPDFGNSKYVYGGDYLLLRSLLALKQIGNTIELPSVIEPLIEQVYNETHELQTTPAIAQRMIAAKAEYEDKLSALRYQAQARLLKRPSCDAELSQIAGSDLEEDNPEIHKAFQALTRWSDQPSISVICLHQGEQGIYLDANLSRRVDLFRKPDEVTLQSLMERSVDLPGWSIYTHFLNTVEVPPAWKNKDSLDTTGLQFSPTELSAEKASG